MAVPRIILAGFVACFLAASSRAIDRVSSRPTQPFVIDHRSGLEAGLDLSFLLKAPAGQAGFITRQGDHLVDGAGKPIRLWGTNITDWTPGSIQIPTKADSQFWARTLARFGINVVRLTFLDLAAPRGLIAADRDDTRELDPAKLDDFDAWVAALKKDGIYVDINLLVGRTFKEGDQVADWPNVGWAKALAYFDPRLIELQKEFAKELLTHRNPYTGTTYAREPAIAIVELVNENSLWDAWYYDRLHPPAEWPKDVNFRPTPPFYSEELDRLYNAYLGVHLTAAQLLRSAPRGRSGRRSTRSPDGQGRLDPGDIPADARRVGLHHRCRAALLPGDEPIFQGRA